MATQPANTFTLDELEKFGRAVLEAVDEEALRMSDREEAQANPVTFDVDVEVRFLTGSAEPSTSDAERRRPRDDDPCCVCVRVGDSGRVCQGKCCS